MRILLLVTVCAAACGDNASSGVDARPDAMPDAAPDAASPEPACSPVVGEPALGLALYASGLRKPVFAATPPGDDRLFVLEQHAGQVRIVEPAGPGEGRLLDEPFLDIGSEIARAFEQGVIGLAFHPGYQANGRFFLAYTREPDDTVVIEEWRAADRNRADPDSRVVLLEIEQSRDYHNGGRLHFGADGMLWIGTGDGGPQFDLDGHAQDPLSLRGKLLRIDVDDVPDGAPYGIPVDNPFADSGRPEVFALGLRNPWAFSIDPATGHAFVGDVGFDSAEEIDVVPYGTSGQNFGWPVLEGADECIDPDTCDPAGMTAPAHEYGHDDGCSVIGGVVYRGCAMPGHRGKYFYSDFCGRWLRSLVYTEAGGAALHAEWPEAAAPGNVAGLVSGPGGEMFVLDIDSGDIYQLVPGDGPAKLTD